VRISSSFLRKELTPDLRSAAGIVAVALAISTLLAGAVSGAALRPLAAISAQLDSISAGKFDVTAAPPDGLAALARDIDYSESRYTAARWVFGRNAYTTSCEESKAIVWASRSVAIVPTRRNCAVSKISMTPGSPTAT